MLFIAQLFFTHILFSAQTIHVFGDSHSSFCFSNNGKLAPHELSYFQIESNEQQLSIPFSIKWLGSITMHRVGRDGIKFLNLKNHGIQENDIAVFVFGEIDARAHILKQRDEHNRPTEEIINTLVSNYMQTLNENKKQYNNITIISMSIIPPTDRCFNAKHPFYGTLNDRIAVTKQLNEKLKNECVMHGFEFLDIFDLCATPEGALKFEMSDTCVHINFQHNYIIRKKLIDQLLEKKILS